MGINTAGLELVKRFEGLYLKAYKCPAGVWTIGWGHTGKVDGVKISSGMSITKAKAEELLKNDLERFWGYVNKTDYVPLVNSMNANQKAALCSLAFNCGENCLRTLCKGRSLSEIADAILLYNKANGKVSQGLAERRKAERELFLSGYASGYAPDKDDGNILSTLRKGDRGVMVKVLQKLLGFSGEDVDGILGNETEIAVKRFQAERELDADGVAGPKTWDELLS